MNEQDADFFTTTETQTYTKAPYENLERAHTKTYTRGCCTCAHTFDAEFVHSQTTKIFTRLPVSASRPS